MNFIFRDVKLSAFARAILIMCWLFLELIEIDAFKRVVR